MPFRQVIINGRSVVISVAEMVNTGPTTAVYRPVHALSAAMLDETMKRTEDAIKTAGVIPPAELNKLCGVKLTSLDHPSPEDPHEHSTGILLNEQNEAMGKIHVTKNPALQTPARLGNSSGNVGSAGQDAGK
ncbi:hypothetical protein FQN50_000449 [Emmonsiellopsis sp. PD_5]|nr:hypothetical protein FQN50_000449 [Emmonsiellopsis sp. PD_5]